MPWDLIQFPLLHIGEWIIVNQNFVVFNLHRLLVIAPLQHRSNWWSMIGSTSNPNYNSFYYYHHNLLSFSTFLYYSFRTLLSHVTIFNFEHFFEVNHVLLSHTHFFLKFTFLSVIYTSFFLRTVIPLLVWINSNACIFLKAHT